MASIILGVVAFIIVTASTIIFYKARASQVPDVVAQDRPTLDSTFHEFKNEIADLAKDNGSILTSDINYEIISKNRKLINDSIADAYHGVPAARDVVIGLARNFAERRFRDKAEIMVSSFALSTAKTFPLFRTSGGFPSWRRLSVTAFRSPPSAPRSARSV